MHDRNVRTPKFNFDKVATQKPLVSFMFSTYRNDRSDHLTTVLILIYPKLVNGLRLGSIALIYATLFTGLTFLLNKRLHAEENI